MLKIVKVFLKIIIKAVRYCLQPLLYFIHYLIISIVNAYKILQVNFPNYVKLYFKVYKSEKKI